MKGWLLCLTQLLLEARDLAGAPVLWGVKWKLVMDSGLGTGKPGLTESHHQQAGWSPCPLCLPYSAALKDSS
jgi:hypothetical protein